MLFVRRSADIVPTGIDTLEIRRRYFRRHSRRLGIARTVAVAVILGAAAFWLLVAGFTAAFLGS